MIFWEGWFLSQCDADFRECLRILFLAWRAPMWAVWLGGAALMDKFHDVLEQGAVCVTQRSAPLSKQP